MELSLLSSMDYRSHKFDCVKWETEPHISVDLAPTELLEGAREWARVSVALVVVKDINPLHLGRFSLLAHR